jgi:hypothetical protein
VRQLQAPASLPEHALLAEGFTQAQLDAGIELYEAVGCDECTEATRAGPASTR